MSEIDTLKTALQQPVPAIHVSSEVEFLRNYAIDGILPRLVVTPTTVEQTAQVVGFTHEQGLALLARGGGSRISIGGLSEHIDVLIETNRLTQLLEHEAADLTCHIEAGLTLAELQAQLATKGQQLALDPPDAEQATIGGLLASNASGPKRLRYGTARDQVIGLHVVQANGEIARSGGNVVKNVAGYDLNKLYIGSFGTLGIIVEVNFRLHPLPAAEKTLLLTFVDAGQAMQTTLALLASLLTPSAFELIDAGAASDMNDFFGLNLPTSGYTLAVNFEGSRATIDRQLAETHILARRHEALLGDDLTGEAQTHFWNAVREHMQGSVTCKVAILPSQIAPYLHHVEQVCRHHDLETAVVAHAGNGVLYLELRPSDAISRLIPAIVALRTHAQQARGSLVVEHCPVELKRRISVWGEPGPDFYLMQRLKQQFDPEGTFVRGRFVGGL